jgi:hypothetical protein
MLVVFFRNAWRSSVIAGGHRTFALAGLIIAAGLAWWLWSRPSPASLSVSLGPTRWSCSADSIAIQNTGKRPISTEGWTISLHTTPFSYVFPDRWLMPGAKLYVWPGRGTDDDTNLYTGQETSSWEVGAFRMKGPPVFVAFACHP